MATLNRSPCYGAVEIIHVLLGYYYYYYYFLNTPGSKDPGG